MSIRLLPVAAALLLTLAACGNDAPTTATSVGGGTVAATAEVAQTATVTIARSRFETKELRVAPGTTVVFENTDAFAHTVTSTESSPLAFDSGRLDQSATFEITFDEPGEYAYFCQIHPTMRAVVIVG